MPLEEINLISSRIENKEIASFSTMVGWLDEHGEKEGGSKLKEPERAK